MKVRRLIGVAASALAVCASGAAAQTPTPDPAPLPEPPAPLSVPSPPPVVEPTQAPSVNSTRTGSRKADKNRLEHKSRLNETVRLPLHPPDAGLARKSESRDCGPSVPNNSPEGFLQRVASSLA